MTREKAINPDEEDSGKDYEKKEDIKTPEVYENEEKIQAERNYRSKYGINALAQAKRNEELNGKEVLKIGRDKAEFAQSLDKSGTAKFKNRKKHK